MSTCADSGSMQARRSSAASSCGAGELSAASTTSVFRPIVPSTVVSRSSTTLEKATCGLATSGDVAHQGAGKQPAQAVRLVGGRGRRGKENVVHAVGACRSMSGVQRRGRRRAQAGEHQVHVARVQTPGGRRRTAQRLLHQ